MGSPGLSHSSNFGGHMASFISSLDPISGPFQCPKPLSCALWNSQAAVSKVPCILGLVSECSLHIPSVVPWLFPEDTASPPHQASQGVTIFSPHSLGHIASFYHVQSTIPPSLFCKTLSSASHKIRLYHPLLLILGRSGLLAPCPSPSLLWPSF